MSIYNPPPTYQQIVDTDEQLPQAKGKATQPWIIWANNVVSGDPGELWTPTFSGLTEVGTATKTGLYYIISNSLVYFRITITPATSTSSTAGTTYVDNFPLTITSPATFGVVAGNANAALGTTSVSGNKLYTPTWSALTGMIVLAGLVEAT